MVVGSTPEALGDASQDRDGQVGPGHQGRQHQGQRMRPGQLMINRRGFVTLAAASRAGALLSAARPPAQMAGQTAMCAWWCRSRPAAAPTPSPASSPASSRRSGASRWWSRTAAAAPPISARGGRARRARRLHHAAALDAARGEQVPVSLAAPTIRSPTSRRSR